MPVFLVESYLPRSASALEDASDAARRAAELATGEGVAVRYLRTTLLPSDETCFHLFEAASAADVEAAAARAGLACDRVVEAVAE
jgi:uncharacterized protein DUF4242